MIETAPTNVFGFSPGIATLIGIVTVVSYFVVYLMYYLGKQSAMIVAFFVSLTLACVSMATLYTSLNYNDQGGSAITATFLTILAGLVYIVPVIVWLVNDYAARNPQTKEYSW